MTDTEQGHSNLRGPDDTVVEDAQPTLTEPDATDTPHVDPAVLSTIAGAITPGEVVTATEVDQSGQTPPSGAVVVEGPEA